MPRGLWFGDERGYNATTDVSSLRGVELWFGDERGYNATHETTEGSMPGCGLVMKEDITQPNSEHHRYFIGCGLVMKEDITQRILPKRIFFVRCGLVMKEDITQLV